MRHPHPLPRLALIGASALTTALLLTACVQTAPGDHADLSRPSPIAPIATEQATEQAAQETAVAARRASESRMQLAKGLPSPHLMAMESLQTADYRHVREPADRENYAHFDENPLQRVAENPVSTFSIDVDTASYANVRRFLNDGRLPPKDAVRVEELINYFDYADAGPDGPNTPFAVHTQVGPTPWNANTRLLRIGIKAWEPPREQRPAANLVFLVDVSGSMNAPDKLPLLKRSLRLLTRQLRADDRVSLVVYAGASGVVLAPTPGDKTATIGAALENLHAGGSTNGASGLRLAYDQAREAYIEGGINRVLIATDGDFNVGTVDHDALIDLIERERRGGIALTTLGFGSGNYNDHLMEQLADKGDGNHAYIDSLMEARKVLVDELGATLQTVARDVKIQIEFNPARVAEYRLIGYQNRLLAREDFNNDQVDAGDIGAGHSVTALYELTLTDATPAIDPLRYVDRKPAPQADTSNELAHLKLRYKPVGADSSVLLSRAIDANAIASDLAATDDAFRFAAAVAAFGERLRGGRYLNGLDYAAMIDLASNALGDGDSVQRAGLVELIRLSAALDGSS